MPDYPCIWSVGGLTRCDVSGVSVAGAGEYYGVTSWPLTGTFRRQDSDIGETFVFYILGDPQSFQRAEYWWLLFAVEALYAARLGGDNLVVVREVGEFLSGSQNR